MNHIVIDLDRAKLSVPMPTREQISAAAQKVCSLLVTSECATDVTFKLDDSSEVTRVRKEKGRGVFKEYGAKDYSYLAGFALFCVCIVLARKLFTLGNHTAPKNTAQGDTKDVSEKGNVVA